MKRMISSRDNPLLHTQEDRGQVSAMSDKTPGLLPPIQTSLYSCDKSKVWFLQLVFLIKMIIHRKGLVPSYVADLSLLHGFMQNYLNYSICKTYIPVYIPLFSSTCAKTSLYIWFATRLEETILYNNGLLITSKQHYLTSKRHKAGNNL